MGNFFLNLFIVLTLVAPGDGRIRVAAFALCMLTNINKLRYTFERFSIFLVFVIVVLFGISVVYIRGINNDVNLMSVFLLGIFFLEPTKIKITTGLHIASMSIIFMTLLYLLLVYYFPGIELVLVPLLDNFFHGEPRERQIIYFLRIFSVFHLASPILVFSLAIVWYQYLMNRKIKNIIYTFLIFICLIFSGTRANFFSAILIVLIVYLHYSFFVKKRMVRTIFWLTATSFLAIIGTYILLIRMDSSSIAKLGHFHSYMELFNNNISYFLLGQGAGAYFFTFGFNEVTSGTELSYLELIRMFGIFATLLILFIYILPFLKNRNYRLPGVFSIGIAYLAYLFIAGTNPLLVGRTGFIVLWLAYTLFVQEGHKCA